MRRAKTIDEIFDLVKDHDVVLCNDAPLMTALNNRIDSPRIGNLAVTPRHIASREAVNVLGENIWSDLRIISHISEITGYDIQLVHGEVENIRSIRRYTKNVEMHLHGRSKRIYKIFRELPTEEKVMEEYDAQKSGLFFNRRVAIIGLEMFNDLDKHFTPLDYDEVELFTDDDHGIDLIYEEGNDRRMAESAVSLITQENANDIAIVLDSGSPVADAVRSALYRNSIPFKNSLLARDLIQVRDYVEMLNHSMMYDTVRAGHVRELFASCGGDIPVEYDEYLLSKIADTLRGRSAEICDAMSNVSGMTFAEFCNIVINPHGNAGMYRMPIKTILNEMNISEKRIDERTVATLSYAVNSMELKHNEEIPDDEKTGVTITDCANSMFIDRPIVIYLGMGLDWYRAPYGRRYIDWEDERERNVMRFQMLIQQGIDRVYMVNSMRNGKQARPCVLFDDILGKDVKTFRDITDVTKGWHTPSTLSSIAKDDVPVKHVESLFTKSSFNSFSECPRKFMFSMLVRMPGNIHAVFGNIIHEFAEFCICYPELVEKNGLKYYEELIMKRFSGISDRDRSQMDRSRIAAAIANIAEFVRSNVKNVPLDRQAKNNFLMEHHGLTMASSATESAHTSSKAPLYGRFDLVADGTIVDFKTGRKKPTETIKRMMSGDPKEYVEFQPMVYLTILSDMGCDGVFRMFNAIEMPENAISGNPDTDSCITDISISTAGIKEFAMGEMKWIAEDVCGGEIAKWDEIADRIAQIGIPDRPEDWIDDDELSRLFQKNVQKPKNTLKKLAKMAAGWAFDTGTSIIVFAEQLNRFREMIKEKHDEMRSFRSSKFPGNPERCEKCDYFSICTIGGVKDAE